MQIIITSIHIRNQPQELAEGAPCQSSHRTQHLHKQDEDGLTVGALLKEVKVDVSIVGLLQWQTVDGSRLLFIGIATGGVPVLVQAFEEGDQVFDPLLGQFTQQVDSCVTDKGLTEDDLGLKGLHLGIESKAIQNCPFDETVKPFLVICVIVYIPFGSISSAQQWLQEGHDIL